MTLLKDCKLDIDVFLRYSKKELGLVRINFGTYTKRKAFEKYMNEMFSDWVNYRLYLDLGDCGDYHFEQHRVVDHYLLAMALAYCDNNQIDYELKEDDDDM